jgi:hypothetical protein
LRNNLQAGFSRSSCWGTRRAFANLETKISYRFVGDRSREDRPLSDINADMSCRRARLYISDPLSWLRALILMVISGPELR